MSRLRLIAVVALLLPVLAAGADGEAPLLGSGCPPGLFVDDEFRDAALAALERLVVHAPGRAAHGAVRANESPGHVDTQGRAWQQVSAYQVNLGMIGALRVAPTLLPVATRWLRWQARHIPLSGSARGVVLDHWVRAGDFEQSTCPDGMAAQQCGHVDAFDSTAASTLLMADAYLRQGGKLALLREAKVHKALAAAADAMARLTTPQGLSFAKPTHRVAYTMDAVEVAAGWRAWARLQQAAYGQPQRAAASLAMAARGESAIGARLWDAEVQAWRVELGAGALQRSRWYPDTVAQAWPLLWGSDAGSTERAAKVWREATARWTGTDDWARRNVDPDGFWWPAAAVAAACTGDADAARTWVTRAREHWLDESAPFAWPFQVGDLLWLLWLAEPVKAAQ